MIRTKSLGPSHVAGQYLPGGGTAPPSSTQAPGIASSEIGQHAAPPVMPPEQPARQMHSVAMIRTGDTQPV